MEPHTLGQRPMNAAQRKKETFIPNVSRAIPKKGQKELEEMNIYVTSYNIIESASWTGRNVSITSTVDQTSFPTALCD